MKKSLLLLIVVFCLFSLIGCSTPEQESSDKNPVNLSPNTDITVFSQFFDSENFVPGISQGVFLEQMGKYSYEGMTVSESALGYFYDGPYGGGYKAGGELFGFHNDYTVKDNLVSYSNQFSTKVELDGLKLPYEIDFKDSLADVFQKMGNPINPYDDFCADKGSYTDMTLYRDDHATFIFQDMKRVAEPVDYEMPYILIYSETYPIKRADGHSAFVERKIKMSFLDKDGTENDLIGFFEIIVNETYERK